MISDLIGEKHSKINCWELVREVYKRKDLDIPKYNIAANESIRVSKAFLEGLKSSETHGVKWEKLNSPEDGCLVLIRLRGKIVSHCGVYLENGKFIHSLSDAGVVISRIDDPKWKMKIEGFYRYIG